MRIGLLAEDCHKGFPNLAILKIAAYHKRMGDDVFIYNPMEHYDRVYWSKVFTFKPKYAYPIQADEVVKGGTGFGAPYKQLPEEIDRMQPDYSFAFKWKRDWAIGFLTRGCIRKCPWCVVPKAEGHVRPYMDVDEIAIEGRTNLFLMDNNILASDYGLQQIEKISKLGYRVDFNQAMDARVVTDEVAKLLARTKWIDFIRFGCDTAGQVDFCERAIEMIRSHGFKGRFELYTMLHGDVKECYERITKWRHPKYNGKVLCQAQPMLDLESVVQNIPRWQMDMAHWCNQKQLYATIDFKDYKPRRNFKCDFYFK